MLWLHTAKKSHHTCFSFPRHFISPQNFCLALILGAAKQLLCPTFKWTTLHSWKKTNPKSWIRRGCFIHLVWNIALLIWVCRDHLDRSLWKCLNTYCSFSSPAPVAARIHTHSHHIFCHSVSTVVLPVWVLLQRDREEGRKAAVSSVRWSLVNKCK